MRHPEQRVTEPKDLGILMNMNLQKIKLGEVCRFINGRAYSQPELLDSGKYKVLRVGNIFEGNHWYYSDMELDDDKYCNEGDLLYSWACTFGPYIWHGPKTIYHYHIWKVEPNQSLVDKHFLYYFLNHQTKGFMGSTHGSTMIHITKENMENFEVLLPSLSDQKKIASVLSALDDKIALNKKMNQKLEAMAKRLYDYWFVQYDFPDKNGHPYKTTGGPMTYNPTLKREIPVGWEVSRFTDFGFFKNGVNYDKNETGDETVKIVNVRNISDSTTYFNIDELDDITLKSDDIQKFIATPKDILLARSGSPGATRLLPHTDKKIIYCGFIIRYQLNEQDLDKQLYLFHVLKGYEQVTSTQSAGSILKNISQDTLNSLTVVMPQSNVLDDFNKKIAPIYSMLRKNISELNKLTILRDKLLPLLMNGQVVVG